jgi:hypothetical protein
MSAGAPINSDSLRRLDAIIAEDRPCRRCGYNIRGLRVGGRCPECGTAVRVVGRPRGEAAINDAPIEHLHALRTGSLLMLLGGPVGTAAFVVAIQTEQVSNGNAFTASIGLVATLGLLAWAVGAWMVHSPAPSPRTTKARSAWPTTNRLLAFAPVVTCGCLYLQLFFGPRPEWLIAAAIMLVVSLAGFLSFCYYASSLCLWAGDDETAERFRVSGFVAIIGGILFGLAFSGTLVFIIFNGAGVLSIPAACVTGLLTIYCTWGAIRCLYSLHANFRWAITNRFESMDADVRIADRIRRRIEENQSDASRKKARHINNP